MPSHSCLLIAWPSADRVEGFGGGGLPGWGVRSGDISTCMPLLNAKLCSMQHAPIILQTKSGEYNSVPPVLSRHRNRDFSMPKVRSTIARVWTCTSLYFLCPGVWGFLKGVIRWGPNAYPESPVREKTGGY